MREIVLDTETTGLSVENGHRIVEIGCIELNDQILTSNRFHCYLNPQRKVSEEAFKVHGYSDDFLSDKKKFDEIADDFILKDQVIDTLDIAREKFPGSQISLDALCKRFRIDNSKRKLHTALIDCELLSKVYINLIDQKEPKLDFFEKKDELTIVKNSNINFCRHVVQPTLSELKEHQNFLKKSLKKNYF